MADKVRCKNCGLLTTRSLTTHQPIEALGARRDSAIRLDGGPRLEVEFFCYLDNPKFPPLPQRPNDGMQYEDTWQTKARISTEIECNDWEQYHPGQSPQDILQMLSIKEQREAERSWREDQAQKDRDWKDRDRSDRAEEARKVERRFRINLWITIGIAVLSPLLSAMIQRYLLPSPATHQSPPWTYSPPVIFDGKPVPQPGQPALKGPDAQK